MPRARLAALPLVLSAPATAAVSVSDDSLALTLGAQLQTRAQRSIASDATGSPYDVVLGRSGRSDLADLSIRRFRLTLGGTYQTAYRFALSTTAEGVDGAGSGSSRGMEIYKGWVDREFYDGGLTQTIHAGLDHPFFNRSVAGDAYYLFPQQRASAALMAPRGVGVRYKVSSEALDFGVDVMNGLDPAKPAANADEADGLFYSARLEISLMDGKKPAYRESYAGESGEGALLAVDIGYDQADHATALMKTHALGYGVEGVLHLDALSALAELRWLRSRSESTVGAGDVSLNQNVYLIQLGYAVPLDAGMVIEPALRFTILNFDTTGDEVYDTAADPDSEWGSSGRQYDVGINLYFNRHANKAQLSYARWEAESGQGRADIVRLQHQFFF